MANRVRRYMLKILVIFIVGLSLIMSEGQGMVLAGGFALEVLGESDDDVGVVVVVFQPVEFLLLVVH